MDSAFVWFEKAAELGDPQSQYILGNMYDFGESVPVNNEKAYFWYQKAADQNHSDALFNVGVFYERGRFVKQDLEKAVFYYRKSARLGSKDALIASHQIEEYLAYKFFKIAITYVDNNEFEQSIPYFEKSGRYGSPQAYYNLGLLFTKGEEIPKNLPKAKDYFEKSANMGYLKAKEVLNSFFY